MKNRFAKSTLALLLSLALIVGLVPTFGAAQLEEIPADDAVLAEETPTEAENLPIESATSDASTLTEITEAEIAEEAVSPKARVAGDPAGKQSDLSSLNIAFGQLTQGTDLNALSSTMRITGSGSAGGVDHLRGSVRWTNGTVADRYDYGYNAVITVETTEGEVFLPSLLQNTNAVTIRTGGTNPISPVINSISYVDEQDHTRIQIDCTFTLFAVITEVRIVVPAPVDGATAYDLPQVATATLNDGSKVENAVLPQVTWLYVKLEKDEIYGPDGQYIRTDYFSDAQRDRGASVGRTFFTPSTQTTTDENGNEHRRQTSYWYYPQFSMGPKGTYVFADSVAVNFFALNSSGTEVGVGGTTSQGSGRIYVNPTPAVDDLRLSRAEDLENILIGSGSSWMKSTDAKNPITSVYLNIDLPATAFVEGEAVPQLNYQTGPAQNISATFLGTLLDLPLGGQGIQAIEWGTGVQGGRFDTVNTGRKAELIVRANPPSGFSFSSGFNKSELHAKWGAGNFGQDDVNVYTNSGYIEIHLMVDVMKAPIRALESISLMAGDQAAPQVGQLLSDIAVENIPYRFSNGTGEFTPLSDYDLNHEEGTFRTKIEIQRAGSQTWTLAAADRGQINFRDAIRVTLTLTAPEECSFPRAVRSAQDRESIVRPNDFTWPEMDTEGGWTVDWAVPGKPTEANPENNATTITMYKVFYMPERIATMHFDMTDLVVGEAMPSIAAIGAQSQTADAENLDTQAFDTQIEWTLDGEAAETSMYGRTYKAVATITSKNEQYGFDDKNLNFTVGGSISWGSAVQPEKVELTGDGVSAQLGSNVCVITMAVTVPKGEIRALEIIPAELQLTADENIGRPTPRAVNVILYGGAANDKNDVGSAGIFAADAAIPGSLVWTLQPPYSLPETSSNIAIQGRDYSGVADFSVPEIGQTYIFNASGVESRILDLYGSPKINADGTSGAVQITDLATVAKRAIDRVELKIAPPMRGLSLAELGAVPLETHLICYSGDEKVADSTDSVTIGDYQDGGSPDLYGANITVQLEDEVYAKYFFRYSDPKFSLDAVSINIGQTTGISQFRVLGQDYLTDPEDAKRVGQGFTLTNYLLPASRGVDKVELDIFAPWSASKPEVRVEKTNAAEADYDVQTPVINFTTGQGGNYSGILVVTAKDATQTDGGSIFRNEQNSDLGETAGMKWSSPLNHIVIHGMNDSEVTLSADPTRGFKYEDDRLEVPFTIKYAPQQIDDVKLYVPRPILGVDPVDNVDLAQPQRESRYQVVGTTWTRNAGAEKEDPYTATVTVAANRPSPISKFDDEYYFSPDSWNKAWTREELDEVVQFLDAGSDPDDPVQPLNARVEDGRLILELLVYPRQVENEISNVRLAISEPKLSQVQASSQDLLSSNLIRQVTYYNTNVSDRPFEISDPSEIGSVISSVSAGTWQLQANGRYKAHFTVRPSSEYAFRNFQPEWDLLLTVDGDAAPSNIEVDSSGTLSFDIETALEDDIRLLVRTLPAEGAGTIAQTAALLAATPGADGTVELRATPAEGYSLSNTASDLQMDNRVSLAGSRGISGRGYAYSLRVGNNVTPQSKAAVTVVFTPHDIVLPRADGMTLTVNGGAYAAGTPVAAGSEVTVQIQNGYELRPGRQLTLYNTLTDAPLEVLKTTDNRTFTFVMPNCPVEIDGRVVRPGDPDPDPTPRPSARPTIDPSGPDDPSDPTSQPSASDPATPSPSPSPSGSPSAKPSSSQTWEPGASDDYIKSYKLDDLQTVAGSPVTLSGSGSDKMIKGYQVTSGSSALVRDLAGQYYLPDGLDIQVVNSSGKVLKSTDKVATGHTVQLINSRKHVLDSAVVSLQGDVTGTGVIGISQLVRLAKAVTYEQPLKEPYFSAGDMNGNGRIDLGDMVQVAKVLANR